MAGKTSVVLGAGTQLHIRLITAIKATGRRLVCMGEEGGSGEVSELDARIRADQERDASQRFQRHRASQSLDASGERLRGNSTRMPGMNKTGLQKQHG
jgi:GH35 family endo-1,4-beta-xylanase